MNAPAAIALADWNLSLASVQEIAEKAGCDVMVGHGVDHAILKGAKATMVMRLGEHGSDHQAVLYVFTLDDSTKVRVLWWNVYVGQDPNAVLREVATMVDRHQPHIVALCEAYRCRRVLGTVPGYRRLQGRPGRGNESERADVALLVRRDLKVRHRDFAYRMDEPWIGPKHNTPKGPRRYIRSRIDFPAGGTLRVLVAHLPTGGYEGRNKAAVRESADAIAAWLRRRFS